MASGDTPAHLLSLKVMRLSRPELASAWQPFYSSSPSFSAHSSASILSLQGTKPLPTHPKTLRDLTHVSELLTLPASFGSIQLGETFSGCLCVNNETQVPVKVAQFKVEMQTATTKVVLCEIENEEGVQGGDGEQQDVGAKRNRAEVKSGVLVGGDTLERVVSHEIKELGQHVLACTVSYRLPSGFRPVSGSVEDPEDPTLVTFRKFYKFAVTNPLSVKTKIHSARSPSAMLYPQEREKTFLEVHIQNLTQNAIYFERMRLECTDAWDAVDVNIFEDKDTGEQKSVFSGSMALMQPQDTRQYVYILTPKSLDTLPPNYPPGSSINLGRLDISWRSSFGEPGRLLTSMLSRRIPLVSLQQPPAPALPPHLKRTIASEPPRPHSPLQHHHSLSRPGTPPASGQRPATGSMSAVFPHSPIPSAAALPLPTPLPELEATITSRSDRLSSVKLNEPFTLALKLTISTSLTLQHEGSTRRVIAVVQTLRPRDIPLPAPSLPPVAPPATQQQPEAYSPRIPSSGFSTPSSAPVGFNYALAHQKILAASTKPPAPVLAHEDDGNVATSDVSILPPPYYADDEPSKPPATTAGAPGAPPTTSSSKRTDGVIFIGSSSIELPPMEIHLSRTEHPSSRVYESQDFEVTCVGLKQGFQTIGGLRVLIVEDRLIESSVLGSEVSHPLRVDTNKQGTRFRRAVTLKEIEVLGEVWVSS